MEKSIERTLRWAKRSKDAHKRSEDQALFGIVQGGEFRDLRNKSAIETAKMDFDGYSVGGVSVGEDAETKLKMIEYATECMPKDKIRYLMGVGEPVDIIDGVIRGIDIFDCVHPTRLARHTKHILQQQRNAALSFKIQASQSHPKTTDIS